MHFAQQMNRLACIHQLVVLRTNHLVKDWQIAPGAFYNLSAGYKPALGLSWCSSSTVQMLIK